MGDMTPLICITSSLRAENDVRSEVAEEWPKLPALYGTTFVVNTVRWRELSLVGALIPIPL